MNMHRNWRNAVIEMTNLLKAYFKAKRALLGKLAYFSSFAIYNLSNTKGGFLVVGGFFRSARHACHLSQISLLV